MLFKNTCVCLITINTPSTSVFQFTKGKDDKRETERVEVLQGEEPKVPKGYSIEQAEELSQKPGKSYDLKPAGAAVEIPDDVCKIPVVAAQIKQYKRSREIEEVEAISEYESMSREDLNGVASAYGIEVDKKMTDAELIDAINQAESV